VGQAIGTKAKQRRGKSSASTIADPIPLLRKKNRGLRSKKLKNGTVIVSKKKGGENQGKSCMQGGRVAITLSKWGRGRGKG